MSDEALFHALNQLPALDAVFIAASSPWFGAGLGAVAVLLLVARWRWRAWPAVLQLVVAVGVTDAFGARVLKPLVGRVRPSFSLPVDAVRVLAPAADVGSMPSLHAANAFAAATLVTLLVPRAGWALFPVATLIAVSRVGVGVHWPSDVVVGAVLGVGVACAVRFAARWFAERQRCR